VVESGVKQSSTNLPEPFMYGKYTGDLDNACKPITTDKGNHLFLASFLAAAKRDALEIANNKMLDSDSAIIAFRYVITYFVRSLPICTCTMTHNHFFNLVAKC
jgi:hypothetical protein